MSTDYREQQAKNRKNQAQAWRAFLIELENLQSKYKATKTELIDGLGVTRSKFYGFEKDPEQGLNIDRSSILNLWAYLCDTDGRRIPKVARELREQLETEGPDRLLKAAGFTTESESGEALTIQDPQIKRVVRRLESSWIYDDAVRVYITNAILDQILDLGRREREVHMDTIDLGQVGTWPEKSFLQSRNKVVNDKYKKAIYKLIRAGKTEFVPAELFELHQSILEHHELGLSKGAKLRIVDCQFRGLSKNLSKLIGDASSLDSGNEVKTIATKQHDRHSKEIDYYEDISRRAERRLVDLLVSNNLDSFDGQLSAEEDINLSIISTPCLEAKIRYQIETEGYTDSVSIRYSSTSTHVENMLRAMSRGLGYPLGVTGFSIRATGRTEKSLARISIALSKLKEIDSSTPPSHANSSERVEGVYEGWWVTSNTIIGILNATSDAVSRWLYSEDINAREYYEACAQAARLSRDFYDMRKALYEYTPHANNRRGESLQESSSKKEEEETFREKTRKLIDETQAYINKYDREQYNDGFKINVRKLKDQKGMSLIALAHSEIVLGEPLRAEKVLKELESNLVETDANKYSYVLSVYGEACKMSHKFLYGDESFIIGKQWKYGNYRLMQDSIDKLGHYIRDVQSIDFEVYLVVSQLFGTIGVLDFYSSANLNEAGREGFKESTEFLLQAAHYSLRIGHVRRASQWLSFASRICTRLGSPDKSRKLYRNAVSISGDFNSLAVDKLFPLRYSDLESNWSGVSHFLACGEINLLDKNNNEALSSFLNALDVALRASYGKVLPDCLYNIARAARQMATGENSRGFEGSNPFKQWDQQRLEEWKGQFSNQELAGIVYPLIENYLMKGIDQDTDLANLSEKMRDGAVAIWNHWHEGKGSKEHPCAEQMKDWSFLEPLNS